MQNSKMILALKLYLMTDFQNYSPFRKNLGLILIDNMFTLINWTQIDGGV